MSDTIEALEAQSTKEKKFINPMSPSFSFPKELDRGLFLSADIKGNKDVNLGIQLKELYSTPYPKLVSKICKSTGLSESDADYYLHFVINTIPKDSIK